MHLISGSQISYASSDPDHKLSKNDSENKMQAIDILRMKEDVIIREIPEVSEHMKRINMIPLPLMFSRGDFGD